MFYSTLACSSCWNKEIQELINGLPVGYTALTTKVSSYTENNIKLQQEVIDYVTRNIPATLKGSAFYLYLPRFIRCVCVPDGFKYHLRMHNDNGKCVLDALLVFFTWIVYSLECQSHFFRVHKTIHSKQQSQSDQSSFKKTADVVVMGFTTPLDADPIRYLTSESPKTPKIIIADADLRVDEHRIYMAIIAVT